MNLIQSFAGEERFYQKFNRSMFRTADGNVCVVDSTRRRSGTTTGRVITCRKLRFTASGRVSSTWDYEDIPHDFFENMGVFAVPALGWRSWASGKVLVHYAKEPHTYHRGVSTAVLSATTSDLSAYLNEVGAIDIHAELTEPKIVNAIMNPKYIPLREGIQEIREGRLASFVVNENVAVTPREGNTCDLWYRTKVVGSIDDNGVLSCPMKYINELSQEN